MGSIDKQKIRSDKWMQLFMKTGIPASVVAVLSLLVGQWLQSPALGKVFILTAAAAIIIGLLYNLRFVQLSLRQLREQGKR